MAYGHLRGSEGVVSVDAGVAPEDSVRAEQSRLEDKVHEYAMIFFLIP